MTFSIKTEAVLIDSVGDELTVKVIRRAEQEEDREYSFTVNGDQWYYVSRKDILDLSEFLYDSVIDDDTADLIAFLKND